MVCGIIEFGSVSLKKKSLFRNRLRVSRWSIKCGLNGKKGISCYTDCSLSKRSISNYEICLFYLSLLQIQWADACLLVYAVTDRSSFEYATEVLSALKRAPTGGSPAHAPAGASAPMPLALLGNKTDLDHLRQVGNYSIHTQCSQRRAQNPKASAPGSLAWNLAGDSAPLPLVLLGSKNEL